MMTQIYWFRLRLFALAEELGNMRAACRIMGVHPSMYYRWRKPVRRWDLDALRPCERCPPQSLHRAPPEQWLCRARPPDHPGGVLPPHLRARLDSPLHGLRADLAQYLRYYNHDHIGRCTQGRTPAQVLGAAKIWPQRPSR